jgi:light-regulated signal transduction histidine kinase (bacteriophytochrome)
MSELVVELKRSNKDLEQFAYVASHDLQEPLRMVSSFTQLLERKYRDKLDEDANEYIWYVVDGAKRMQSLINDLLSYSRVTTKVKDFAKINLNETVDEALFNLEIAIEENDAIVVVDSLPQIHGDSSQMVQLFQNIIGNAIKYRSEKIPEIHISASEGDQEWIFKIEDNGIGIQPEYNERIFQIFQRLHGSHAYSGTGIGLAICKKIVELHGGSIWVNSKPGEGSIFYFTIPK